MAIHTPRFPNKVPTARHMPSPAPIAMPTASRLSAFIRSDYFPLITAIVSRHCGSSLIGTTISMPVPAYRERRSRESERVRCVPAFITHQFSRIISRRRRRRNIFIPAPRPVALRRLPPPLTPDRSLVRLQTVAPSRPAPRYATAAQRLRSALPQKLRGRGREQLH